MRVKKPELLLLANQAPLDSSCPASGLAVRHTLMARILAEQGFNVCYAWPQQAGQNVAAGTLPGVALLALDGPETLRDWLNQRPGHGCVVLGYWELAALLPSQLNWPLVLDLVAPRWLEQHFESPSSMAEQLPELLAVLSRCEQVLVGNQRQADGLLALMAMAGHDLRRSDPVHIVPIALPVSESAPKTPGQPLRLLVAGQQWPWRRQQRWLEALESAAMESGDWLLEQIGGDGRLLSHQQYLARLDACDIVIELADENAERRLSQSFRMSDALCRGVAVIGNRYLALAGAIETHAAGWLVDEPADLGPLLRALAAEPQAVSRASRGALSLARAELDAERVYAALARPLHSLARSTPVARTPVSVQSGGRVQAGWRHALAEYRRNWVEHRLRRPLQRFWQRLARQRPQPTQDKQCWVVLSRPDIFPPNHGAAVKIERTAWGLSFHVDQVLLLTDDRREYRVYRRGECQRQRFPLWLRCLGWPRRVNLLRLLARGLPMSNAFLYLPLVDRSLQWRLLWLLRQYPVSVVQGEFPAYASPAVWSARLFGTASLMVEHNVEFARIAEQVDGVSDSQVDVLRRIETTLANACDRVITVSEPDRQALIEHGVQPGRIATIPHGVDLQAFADSPAVDLRGRYGIPADHAVLVYHGIYSYQPNADAVRELSEVLLPALKKRGIAASVVAIGPRPLQEDLPGLVFAGAVDDLAGHLKGGDLAVIPLRQGGGTRMKILDDFAARVAVVSTSKGMEGIPVQHGEQIWVVDDAEQMADDVAALLQDSARRQALADSAWQWVQALDWRQIAARYVRLMND